jgi:sugar phosphate isomerase/epimerase
MGNFRLGCQTITWGEGQSQRLSEVFGEAADAGYQGLEIGFRHIRATPPNELNHLLERHELTLLGTHIGGNLMDRAGAEGEQRTIDQILDYLTQTDARLLMYSGLRFEDHAQFDRDLGSLREASDLCAGRGVQLLYHNHDWEFENGGQVISAVLDQGLRLCPDLGWIMKGGEDMIGFLDRTKSQIGAVHFKDFASADRAVGASDTVLLGQGVAPLKEAAVWLTANLDGLWVIAEQDNSPLSPSEAALANEEAMRGFFGEALA